jgi:2-dehydro-3-deoxygluconokinase
MDFDVITVGEPLALFTARSPGALEHVQDFRMSAAGSELNVAIGLARLGFEVGYLSRVGADAFGRFLVATLAREHIGREHVIVDPGHATGFMLKSLSVDGSDAEIDYYRRGSAASHLGVADCPSAFCARARHLHLTGICAALSATSCELVFHLAREARAWGRTISFDPNLRPRLWPSREAMASCLNELAAHCDVILPGLDEGRLLTGLETPQDIAKFYLDRGARHVAVKLGAAGAFQASATSEARDGEPSGAGHVAAPHVARVVDTVGAGDGFATGVISALLDGLPWPDAVARGNAVGARVVQFSGDSEGLPTRAELGGPGPHPHVVGPCVSSPGISQ